jgi:AcrR family transcriptional regulator
VPSSSLPSSRRVRARRGEGERLREEILEAAEQLLLESGDASTLSIRAIADAVGVSPPSIYLHFADRNELVYAVADRHWCHLTEATDRAVEGIDDPWDRISARGRAYIDFALANPEHYRVIMMGRHDQVPEDNTDDLPPGYEHLLEDVRAAMGQGRLANEDDPVLVATGLWMLVHGVASLIIAKPDFPWPPRQRLIDHVLGAYSSGLSGRPDERF